MGELTIEEFKKYSNLIDEDVYDYITVEHSVNIRKNVGSTSPKNVLKSAKNVLESLKKKKNIKK